VEKVLACVRVRGSRACVCAGRVRACARVACVRARARARGSRVRVRACAGADANRVRVRVRKEILQKTRGKKLPLACACACVRVQGFFRVCAGARKRAREGFIACVGAHVPLRVLRAREGVLGAREGNFAYVRGRVLFFRERGRAHSFFFACVWARSFFFAWVYAIAFLRASRRSFSKKDGGKISLRVCAYVRTRSIPEHSGYLFSR